jgi:hypothetical protein
MNDPNSGILVKVQGALIHHAHCIMPSHMMISGTGIKEGMMKPLLSVETRNSACKGYFQCNSCASEIQLTLAKIYTIY